MISVKGIFHNRSLSVRFEKLQALRRHRFHALSDHHGSYSARLVYSTRAFRSPSASSFRAPARSAVSARLLSGPLPQSRQGGDRSPSWNGKPNEETV